MMKNLLLLAALAASAMGAAVLYKEVGVDPYGTYHTLGWDIGKQDGGGIHDASSVFPWYGHQQKEYLVAALQPNYHYHQVGPIGHQTGYPDSDDQLETLFHTAKHQVGLHSGHVGVIGSTELNPTVSVVHKPLGMHGNEWQGVLHGTDGHSDHHYADDSDELLHGTQVQHQFGHTIGVDSHLNDAPIGQHKFWLNHQSASQIGHHNQGQGELHGIVFQGKYYPTQQEYPYQQMGHHRIGSEEIEAFKSHGISHTAMPTGGYPLGGSSHYNTNDDLSSILLHKLYPTKHVAGSVFSHQTGHGLEEDTQGYQIPLTYVGSYGHGGVVGGMYQPKVIPSPTLSGPHQWHWNVGDHHY